MQKNRYDAEGLRVEKEESGTIFRYLYDRGELFAVEEQKASQTSQRQLIRGHQVLGSRDTKGNLCYYHQNEQGSTQTITNEKQEVKAVICRKLLEES